MWVAYMGLWLTREVLQWMELIIANPTAINLSA